VWQEFAKGLAEEHPEKMFEVLKQCGLMEKFLPEIQRIPGAFSGSLPVRFSLLAWPLQAKQVEGIAERLRAPNDVRELGVLASRNRDTLKNARTPADLFAVLKNTDAFRRPERFGELLETARLNGIDTHRFEKARAAAAAVDAGAIAARAPSDKEIGRLVDEARLNSINEALNKPA